MKITIGNDPEKFFQIGSQLSQREREELIEFLKQNIDVFTWSTYEALGVDPEFICHHLNVNSLVAPKKQPPKSSPLGVHPKSMQKQSKRRKQNSSRLGLLRRSSILNG